jgi:hypothetical protein
MIWRGFDLPEVIFWRGFELLGRDPLEKLTGKARKKSYSLSQIYIYEYVYSEDNMFLFVGMPRKDTEKVKALLVLEPLSLDISEEIYLSGYGKDHIEAIADCDRKARLFSDRLMKGL